MDMQNVSNLVIPEGNVRTIHDDNGRLLWGKLEYDTKYKGDALQNGTPTPDAPQDIRVVTGTQTVTVTGKNLFTGNYSQFNSAGGSGTTYAYFKLPDDGAYTLTLTAKNSVTGSPTTYLGFTATGGSTTNPRAWAFGSSSTGNAGTVFSITNVVNGENLQYVSLYNKFSANLKWFTDNFDIQLEKGSATDYEPYQGSTYTVNLGTTELCKIGDYQDYIYKSGNDWYVHKEVEKTTLSNLTWQYFTIAGHIRFSSTSLANRVLYPATNSDKASILCTNYSVETYANVFNNTTDVKISVSNTGTTSVYDSNYTSLSDFLSGVGSGSLYYALATPTETQITDTALIAQLNNIHQFLTRYGYSATVSGNLPIIISKTDLS